MTISYVIMSENYILPDLWKWTGSWINILEIVQYIQEEWTKTHEC